MKIISLIFVYLLFTNFGIAQKVNPFQWQADSLSSNYMALMKDIVSKKELDTLESPHKNLTYFRRELISVIPIPPATSKNSQLKHLPLYLNDREIDFLTLKRDSISLK